MNALKYYAEENNYHLLSKFKTVEEFNNHFEQSMLLHKDKFTKSEYLALNKLRKFAYSEKSPNTVGVAWVRAQKVVAATHKETLHLTESFGISRSTFNRMLRKAKKLNLVTVINQYDEHRYKKHNVYVFNRLEDLTPESFGKVEIVSESNTIEASKIEKTDATVTLILELPKLKEKPITYQKEETVNNQKIEKFVKNPSLRAKMRNQIMKRNMSHDALNEFALIAYSEIKKTMNQNNELTKTYLEKIAYEKFLYVIDQSNINNMFALFTYLLRKDFGCLLDKDNSVINDVAKEVELDYKRGMNFSYIPNWMIENTTDPIKKARMIAINELLDKIKRGEIRAIRKHGTKTEVVPKWFNETKEEAARKRVEDEAKMSTPEMQKRLKEIQDYFKMRSK